MTRCPECGMPLFSFTGGKWIVRAHLRVCPARKKPKRKKKEAKK